MILAVLLAAISSCQVEAAHYRLRTQPSITASFRRVDSGRDWPAGLAFRIHSGVTNRSFWWLPWNGGTSQLQHLASTTDVEARGWRPPSPDGGPRPLGDVDYLATDKAYNLIGEVPRRGERAPAHILLPNLADVLSHGADELVPKQYFDLVSCTPHRF